MFLLVSNIFLIRLTSYKIPIQCLWNCIEIFTIFLIKYRKKSWCTPSLKLLFNSEFFKHSCLFPFWNIPSLVNNSFLFLCWDQHHSFSDASFLLTFCLIIFLEHIFHAYYFWFNIFLNYNDIFFMN